MTKVEPKIYTIDATDKAIGRVASQAAAYLRGKNTAAFVRHLMPNVKVAITNASRARITPKKARTKVYTRYTGYPGGLRQPTLEQVVAKRGHGELFRQAVRGMLPTNKLRDKLLKQLTVTE